jgi:hypothetical protein
MLYLQLLIPSSEKRGEPKDSLRKIEKNLKEQISMAQNKFPYRTGRLMILLNIVNLMNYSRYNEPPRETLDLIMKGASRFSKEKQPPCLSVLSPVLLQMYARYHLMSETNKCYRMFFSSTFMASVFFLKNGGLAEFAKAGYLISSKFYQINNLEGFNLIIQTVFHNLGLIRRDNPAQLLEAVDCFIRALNNFELPSEIPEKTEKYLKSSKLMKAEPGVVTSAPKDNGMLTESIIIHHKVEPKASSSGQRMSKDAVDLLSLPLMTAGLDLTSTMELPHSITSSIRSKPASDAFIAKVKKDLKTLKFGAQSIETFQEKIFDLENGTFSDAKLLKEQLEKIMEVVEYKLEKKESDLLNSRLKLALIPGTLKQALSCARPREISAGEPVYFRFPVTNQYYRTVVEELKSIQLEMEYLESWSGTMGKVPINQQHKIPAHELQEHLTFEVICPELTPNSTVDLDIIVRFKKIGFYQLRAITWKWFDCVVFRHELEMYKIIGQINNYTVLKVINDASHLETTVVGLKPKLQFGEVHKSVLCARTIGNKTIDECYMISSEPLFTGFGFKSIGAIYPSQPLDLEFYLRGTQTGSQTIPIMFLYRTSGTIKYMISFFRVGVEATFASKSTIDDLQNGTRLITLDILANPKEGAPRIDQLEICSICLNSNHWEIMPDSSKSQILGVPPSLLFTLQIKPVRHDDEDIAFLKRKHREIFKNPANMLQLTSDSLEYIQNFLVHENLAITKGPNQEELCRNYIEITLIMKAKYQHETIFFMRSLTELKTFSYSWPNKDKSQQQLRSVKAKLLVPSVVEHNFDECSVLNLPVEVSVDCSMLSLADHPHIFVRAVNPTEKRPEARKAGSEKPMKENLFNWVGKTKLMIEKVSNSELPPIRKERDWTETRRLFEAVSNIKQYALFDAKTADIWMASPDFKFDVYEEGPENSKQFTIDEKALAIKYFHLHGNVKTNIGVRYMRQKFVAKPKGGYDTNRHMAVFLNEARTMGGVAGRTGACIMVGLYAKNPDEPLSQIDPEMQLRKIYQRLLDPDRGYHGATFVENHQVKFNAVFPSPGVYELNAFEFTDSKGNLLHNPCASSETKLVVKHNPALADLL